MITDFAKTRMFARRILGLTQMDTGLMGVLFSTMDRYLKGMTTGGSPAADLGVWLSNVSAADGTGASMTFGQMYGVNGKGKLISLEGGDARITNVPFQNTGGITYYMAGAVYERPAGVVRNPSTGTVEYDTTSEQLGIFGTPTSVTDNGNGTLTANLTALLPHASDNYSGRTAYIWLATPQSEDEATAIEEVIISGANLVVTLGALGQSVISTTAAQYRVSIDGPVITRANQSAATERAYIGTVVGGAAPRVIDVTAQPILPNLLQVSRVPKFLLHKGWLTEPAVTATLGTNAVSWTAGVAFNNGQYRVTNSGSLTPIGVGLERWFALDQNTALGASVTAFATWDLANAGDNVPLCYVRTDGGGNIIEASTLGRKVEQFAEPHVLTVSSNAAHRAMFSSLDEALRWAYSLQASATAHIGIVIEVVGIVDVLAPIAGDVYVNNLRDITIRGRTSSLPRSGQEGAIIRWAYDGSLFALTSTGGTPAMRGWTFEGVTFRCIAVTTSVTAAVISTGNNFSVVDVTFRHCKVDGAGTGSGAGKLAGLVYLNSGTNSRLAIQDCYCELSNYLVYQTTNVAAALTGLRVEDTQLNVAGTTPVGGGTQHFILDEQGGNSSWAIRRCKATTSAESMRLVSLTDSWISDNDFTVTGNLPVVNFTTSGSARLFIRDNALENTSGTFIYMVIAILCDGSGLNIHNNRIKSAVGGAGSYGIHLLSAATPQGWIVSGNHISGPESGIRVINVTRASIVGNIIEGAKYGIAVGFDVGSSCFYSVVTGNIIQCTSSAGTYGIKAWGDWLNISANSVYAFDNAADSGIFLTGDDCVISGNTVELSVANNTGFAIQATGDRCVLSGNNAVGGDYAVALGTGTRGVLTGNCGRGGNTANIHTDSDDSVVVGNNANGTAVSDTSAGSTVASNEV